MVVSMQKGPYTLCWGRKTRSPLGCHEHVPGRRVDSAPDAAVVGIDLIFDMKRALITENYGVQKSLIVLYPIKHLHNHNYPR
jgi:hypothetical protein